MEPYNMKISDITYVSELTPHHFYLAFHSVKWLGAKFAHIPLLAFARKQGDALI